MDWNSLLKDTTNALLDCQATPGVLVDPYTKQETPTHHYALSFASLAACCHGIDEERWLPLIRRWLMIPSDQRGHLPFNRLAFYLISNQEDISVPAKELALQAHAKCKLAQQYPSNNWLYLAQAIRCIESASIADVGLLERMTAKWQTEKGGFIDFPELPDDKLAVPITYHAKMASMLGLVDLLLPDRVEQAPLEKAVRWIMAFADRSVIGGFGRSTNAIFGDAGFIMLAWCAAAKGWSTEAFDEQVLLTRYAESRSLNDGLLSLTNSNEFGIENGWDAYMYHTVYNAYFVGLLSWVQQKLKPKPIKKAKPHKNFHLFKDSAAGLESFKHPAGAAFYSTKGQPIQTLDVNFIDLRYNAIMPFHVRFDSETILPTNTQMLTANAIEKPSGIGWQPLFLDEQNIYTLSRATWVNVKTSQRYLVIAGGGSLERINIPPVKKFSKIWWEATADRAAKGRFFYRRRPLHLPKLLSHHLHRCWVLDFEAQSISVTTIVMPVADSTLMFLNPNGCAWMCNTEIGNNFYDADLHEEIVPYPNTLGAAMSTASKPISWPTELLKSELSTDQPMIAFDQSAGAFSTPLGEIEIDKSGE